MIAPMPLISLRQPTALDRASRMMALFVLSLLAAGVLVFATTAVYPWNPVTKLEITVLGQPRAGADLVVAVDYCKTRAWAPEFVRWSLLNDVTVVLPVTTVSLPVGCQVRRLAIPIPAHVAPGTYMLQEELHYAPWPWKTYTYIRQSAPFYLQGEAQ